MKPLNLSQLGEPFLGKGERGRWGDGETGRQGDGETMNVTRSI
ncbi:MAG: hypothetical protein SWZ49_12770 [Cyanobacteriota bacterium]|nr:hypothetical protein [Cyanobacteriota bacterium]